MRDYCDISARVPGGPGGGPLGGGSAGGCGPGSGCILFLNSLSLIV